MTALPGAPEVRARATAIHRARTDKRVVEPNPPTLYNAGEAEVVMGFQLSEVLKKWVVEWMKIRDPAESSSRMGAKYTKGEKKIVPVGPIQYLSIHTGIDPRRVSGICNGEFQCVPFSQAEKLLIAIDREYMFSNHEIQVVPNPGWTQEKYIEYMQDRGCA